MKANQIQAYTTGPKAALKDIWTKMTAGDIETWEGNAKGWFTHLGEGNQWKNKAWLEPTIVEKQALVLRLWFAKGLDPRKKESVRGVYLGRFSGMLVTHFGERFSNIEIVEAD
jgi:hypothetical protein